MTQDIRLLRLLMLASYLTLLLLVMAWEGWLAPAPGAPPWVWLILKSVPLLIPLGGIVRGRPRTYLLTTLLLMFYFTDGVVLTWLHRADGLDFSRPLPYAIAEWLLATIAFALALLFIRARSRRD